MIEDNVKQSDPEEGDGAATTAVDADGALLRKLRGWFKTDRVAYNKWREQAEEDFRFYDGDQYSKEEKIALQDKMRPVLVFNRVAPLVNAVVGSEINNRREVRFIPREQGDAVPNQILTSAAEWFRDQSDAEDEESAAFRDAVIGGIGWTDTRLDFDEEPDGKPVIDHIDPFEMMRDSRATKPNLTDARRVWRMREMGHEEAEDLFPGVDEADLNNDWIKSTDDQSDPHNQDHARLYDGTNDTDGEETSGGEGKVTVIECQWIEKVPFYRGANPMQPGAMIELSEAEYAQMSQMMPGYQAVRSTKVVVKRAFIGAKVLSVDSPLSPGKFTYQAITGNYDRQDNVHYGVVRATKDPARWSNKFLSQVMHILSSQANGGIMAERGAFEDDAEAEKTYAQPDAITYTEKGAIQNGKIQPKPQAQIPVGFMQLMQEAKQAISDVTGLSPEFIGTRGVDQAGVLEYQRKQSSLNLLAGLFDSLRRYRKIQGRILLYLIQNYLSDGRLVRILGDEGKQYAPLVPSASAEYDIIVDDAPSSPNEKEKTWQIVMSLLPMIKDYLTPEIGMEILEFSPMPASLVERLKKAMETAKEQSAPDQEKKKALAEQAAMGELQKTQTEADRNAAQAELDRASAQEKLMGLQGFMSPVPLAP